MVLMGRVLTASEMMTAGLVTQIFFPGRLMEEVIPRMKRACSDSNLGLQWNKLLLKQHQKSQVEILFEYHDEKHFPMKYFSRLSRLSAENQTCCQKCGVQNSSMSTLSTSSVQKSAFSFRNQRERCFKAVPVTKPSLSIYQQNSSSK